MKTMTKTKKKRKSKKGSREVLVHITRSFGFKFFPRQYEPREFFASASVDVPMKEMATESRKLHDFVRAQVVESVNAYKREMEEYNESQQPQQNPPVVRDKNYYIAEAVGKKKDLSDDDNTNGYVNPVLAAGEREDSSRKFN